MQDAAHRTDSAFAPPALRGFSSPLASQRTSYHCNGKVSDLHEGFCRKDRRHHRRRHGHGPRARAPAGCRGLQRPDVRYLRGADAGDKAALRGRKAAAGPAHHHASPDLSVEEQLKRFRDEIADQQATAKIHLLFNNAGIGGGGSLFTSTTEQREKTFTISSAGVYLCLPTFPPMPM